MAHPAATTQSPPAWVTLPYFYAAPLWLAVGGFFLAHARPESFVAITEPRLLATVHSLAIGWLSTTIMGASQQLIPTVLGGRLLSHRLAPLQLALHSVGLALFVSGLYRWNTGLAAIAGGLLVTSFTLYLLNAGTGLLRAERGGVLRNYLVTSASFLVVAMGLGFTWMLALHFGWLAVSLGRVAAHAHLAMVGWVGITIMGASYQLVPMFSIAREPGVKAPALALGLTSAALIAFASTMLTDPPAMVRIGLATALGLGPGIWLLDMLRIFRVRARRRVDIHGRTTAISWCALCLAVTLGLFAAAGTPLTTAAQPARWPLAYGAAALAGWGGTTVLANSFKIVPFVVWLHRWQRNLGRREVPMVADLSIRWLEHVIVAMVAGGVLAAVAGALLANITLLHSAGWLLAVAAAGQLVALAAVLRPWPAEPAPQQQPVRATPT